mgnify:CR=1 FL=1
MYPKNKHIICVDGFKMSVQANESAYCTPRITDAESYTAVEVGYPSAEESLLLPFAEESLLLPYAENLERPTNTVYGWVPTTVVALVCAKHGGIVEGALPPGVPTFTSAQCGNA